jgi:hypothetical protein
MDSQIIAAIITGAGTIVAAIIAARAGNKKGPPEQVGGGGQHQGNGDAADQGSSGGRAIRWIIAGLFAAGFVGTCQQSAPVYPGPQVGYFCYDMYGNRRCQLAAPQPVGTQCWCPGQGPGVVGP